MNFDALLEKLEAQGARNDETAVNKQDKYLNITRDTGELLSVLIKASKCSDILEIGTSNGYSTLWLASSISEKGKVITVDISAKKLAMARSNLQSVNLQHKVDFIHADFLEFIKGNQRQYDLVFLDADRTQYLSVEKEIVSSIKPGGLLICDNAISHSHELETFIDNIKKNLDFTCSVISVGKGEFIAVKA